MDVLDVNLMRYDMQRMMTKAINGSADIATRNNERLSTVENDRAAIVHSIASVTISMNGLSGSMKEVKGVFDVVANVINGVNEGEQFTKAKSRSHKTMTGLELFANALAAGEAISTLGPYAAAGSFLPVVAGGLRAAQKQEKKDRQNIVSPDFMTKGVSNGYENLGSVVNRQKLVATYAQNAKQKNKSELKREEDLLIAGRMKKGGAIAFDDEQAANNPSYSLALAKVLNMNLGIKKPRINRVVFDDPKELNAFKDHFDEGGLLPTGLTLPVLMPYVESNYLMRKEGVRSKSVKEHRQLTAKGKNIGFLTPDMIQNTLLNNMIDMYIQNDGKYVLRYMEKLQQQFDKSIPIMQRKDLLLSWFNNAKNAIDENRDSRASKSGGEQSRAVAANVIHFNKALIEHFTIHVNDSKEGVRDLKRKVEEVLIEILSSVNTIN